MITEKMTVMVLLLEIGFPPLEGWSVKIKLLIRELALFNKSLI